MELNNFEKEKCGVKELKDSFLQFFYNKALMTWPAENINYFYTTYPLELQKQFSLENIQQTFINILSKQKTKVLLDFLDFFKLRINVNDIFDHKNKLTLLQLVCKQRYSFLKHLLEVFSKEIKITLTENDLPNNESFLINAAKTNNKKLVNLLLKSPNIDFSKININKDFLGNNIVTWATNIGDLSILIMLKEKFPISLNINLLNNLNETSLIISAKKNNVKILDWLISNFKESLLINEKDLNEDTAFFKSLISKKFEICDKIIQNFKNPLLFYQKKNEMGILDILLIKGLSESIKYLLNILKTMPEFQTQLGIKTLEKLLAQAIIKENYEVAAELIENFRDIIDFSFINKGGKSFLSLAVEKEASPILSLLSKSNIDFKKMILLTDEFGETPFSSSIKAKLYDNCFFLLERLSKEDFMSLNQKYSFEKIWLLLFEKANFSLIETALLEEKIVPTETNQYKDSENTILHYLAIGGSVNLLKYLYKNYKSDIIILINKQNSKCETPLIICAKYSQWDLLDFLLEISEINVLIKDSFKKTFLCYVFNNRDDSLIIKYLNKKKHLDVNYSFLGLIEQKLWKKVVLLMKNGFVDNNFYDCGSEKNTLNLIVDLMEPEKEDEICEIFELFDFEHEEIINVKQIFAILIQKNSLKILKIFVTKLRFHDLLNQSLIELSEKILKVEDFKTIHEITQLILKMIEISGNNGVETNYWNNELLKLLPFKINDLKDWSALSPFKLNLSHRFPDMKCKTLLEIVIQNDMSESLKIILDFCESSSIYISKIEELVIQNLKDRKLNIAKILILYRFFDFKYQDKFGRLTLSYLDLKKKKSQNVENLTLQHEILLLFLTNLDLNSNYQNNLESSLFFYLVINKCYDYLLPAFQNNPNMTQILDKADCSGVTLSFKLVKIEKNSKSIKFLNFSKIINKYGIPTINLWQVTKENDGILSYQKENKEFINIMRAHGALEIRQKLIDDGKIKGALNNSESTQLSNVDKTIKESIDRLKLRFNLTLSEISQEHDKINQFFGQLYKLDSKENLAQHLENSIYSAKKMLQYKLSAQEFINIAENQFKKMMENNYNHYSAKIGNIELLALIWKAIYNINEFFFFDEKMIQELIMQRQMTFLRHLVEAAISNVCERGQFNKLLECLNYSHEDVKIDLIDYKDKSFGLINKQEVNLIWKELCVESFKNLPEILQKKYKNQVYFWGEIDQIEKQAILGGFKLAFYENFKKFFPNSENKTPLDEDYKLLEEMLGIFHKDRILDFSIT